MKRNFLAVALLVTSTLIFVACSSNSSDKKETPTPSPVVELMDASGNCTATAEVTFAKTATKVSEYQKNPSTESLAAAQKSCETLQSLIGVKSCLMASAEPKMQLDKNVMGQACSNVSDKSDVGPVENAEVGNSLSQILNGNFIARSGTVNIQVPYSKSYHEERAGYLSAAFTINETSDNGISFSVNFGCSYMN